LGLQNFTEQSSDFESGTFKDKEEGFLEIGNEFTNDPFAGEDPFSEGEALVLFYQKIVAFFFRSSIVTPDDAFKKDALAAGDAFFSNDNFGSAFDSNLEKTSRFNAFTYSNKKVRLNQMYLMIIIFTHLIVLKGIWRFVC
jgi:hypothetical protein